ncbi:glycine betaine/proline transport system substrate-binding protein [Desulfohalotomaculum tongense]|uniref:glycine betaine ABC transporter substrate-binding protein n=1 Tax=Desulforadius tongensis TaxID=1216062 RepID=UPI001956D9EB|nr:glycine betaine ABC transporter substrate-binding protein [Desulforadius tongensis]MBM7855754.1 glycine betaine/proline transport system substrate-binding protein [Desulforadius tongensis]
MRKFAKLFSAVAIVMMFAVALVGCAGGGGGAEDQAAGQKGKVTLGYVQWDSEIASTHVVKEVLESKLGYEVEAVAVDAAPMWAGIAKGQFDAIVSAWLPGTHADYYAKVKDDVENLGPNLEGAKIGLVVPSYVEINSIEELNSVKDKFDGQIVGIEPGAGIMKATEKAIKEYGLDFELVDSSSAAMAASLKKAIDDQQWIAVTGWTPHWKFAKFDLKYLEDPKGVYGGKEHIATIVRKGLKEDNEELYKFLDSFKWTPEDMQAVMLKIEEGMSPEKAAKEWVESNSDKVEKWLP